MSDRSMRAAIVTAPGRTAVIDAPMPQPGPGQIRVRVEGCGVCASNLESWAGPDWMRFPTDAGGLGHEGWGVIDRVGKEVEGLREGDRVAFLGQNSYAEYDVADASAAVLLPPSLDQLAFPGEALGCAVNIFRRSGIELGQTVAIIGIGFLGTVLTRLATKAGARVIAISRRRFALWLAEQQGAAERLPLDDHAAIVARIGELTGGRLCERVIEATGRQAPLDLAAELTGERGRLVIAGYHQDGPRQVNMWLWNWRGLDVINAHERDPRIYVDGIRRAVDLVEEGVLDPRSLVTHRYSLEALGEALDATRDRPDGFVKGAICP